MMRFSFVFLFVVISNPRLSAAEAVTEIPLDADAASETQALKNDVVGWECGISSANVTERIVGGEEAEPHAWPWQVQIACTRNGFSGVCGGSLVYQKWVITAAHCLFVNHSNSKYDINECKVYLGKHYSFTIKQNEPTEVITGIESYFVHEQYRPFISSDIAVLKLDKPVPLDNNIKTICLPNDLPALVNTSICYATGWGLEDPNGNNLAETLKQLQMPIHDDYSYCNLDEDAIELKICAGSLDRQDDVCEGDSGGPLACRETDGKWYLRGVASYVNKGCHSVGAFTRVTAFLDWITEQISGN